MRQGERLSKKKKKAKLLDCLRETSGIVAYACEKAGISRVTYYNWCKEDPEFKRKAEDIQELQIDVAEAALLKKIKNEDTTAIIFYLKTKGKNRGYSERHEIGGINGSPIAMDVDTSTLGEEERKLLLKIAESLNVNG
jgi:hypothetical protein